MQVIINFDTNIEISDSLNLERLSSILTLDFDFEVNNQTSEMHTGAKGQKLTTAIAIAGLAMGTLGTLFSGLSYWQSQHPTYSITIHHQNRSVTVDNLSLEDFMQTVTQWELDDSDEHIEVKVSRGN
jgi:hypothetical protein